MSKQLPRETIEISLVSPASGKYKGKQFRTMRMDLLEKHMNDKQVTAVFDRLQRLETRMVRGFTELGVVVTDDEDWFEVDHVLHSVTVSGASKSIRAIQLALAKSSATPGEVYELFVGDEYTGTILA